MIDFTTVSREFRSLVARRRELFTFLGSVFAGMSLLMQHILQGQLPPALKHLEDRAFATYALLLMVPSLILALRIARLHGGLTLNGILYARLMQEQDFTFKGHPQRAARFNWFGVSFLMFLLVDLIAGFSAGLLALALGAGFALAGAVTAAVVVVWFLLLMRFHRQAASFALHKAATDTCAGVKRDEWEAHIAGSLEDSNHGLISWLAFAGLILFSGFSSLSALSQIKADNLDLVLRDVQEWGPLGIGVLMVGTCLVALVAYIRLRVALGQFSLQLDPTDRPFRPLRLTDSLLGYALLAFLLVVALHVLLFPYLEKRPEVLFGIDGGAFALAILAEQLTLIFAGWRYHGAGK
jgi:hypothetical protein